MLAVKRAGVLLATMLFAGLCGAAVSQEEGKNQVHIQLTNRPDEMVVWWVTEEAVGSVAEYKLESSAQWLRATNYSGPYRYNHLDNNHRPYTSGWIHEVVLPDLALNRQTYLYRARVSRDDEYPWSKTYWFSTRSDEPDAEVKIAALGDQDLPTSPDGRAADSVMDALMERFSSFDFVLHMGGLAYAQGDQPEKESSSGVTRMYPAWEDRWRHGEGRQLPEGNGSAALFWYSFDYGPVHVAVISSQHDDAGMYSWLEEDLKKADSPQSRAFRPWVIVMMHRSVINDGLSARIGRRVESLFTRYRVQIVLSGSCPNYERTYPMYMQNVTDWSQGTTSEPYITNAFATSRGMNNSAPIYLTIGTGGRRGDRCATNEWTVGETKKMYGFGLMEVTRTKLYFEIVDVADRFNDNFLMCTRPGCLDAPDAAVLEARALKLRRKEPAAARAPAPAPLRQQNVSVIYQSANQADAASEGGVPWYREIAEVVTTNYWVLGIVAAAIASVVVFMTVACCVCCDPIPAAPMAQAASDQAGGSDSPRDTEGGSGESRTLLLEEATSSTRHQPFARRVSNPGRKWTSDEIDSTQLEMLAAGCNVVSHALEVESDLDSASVSVNITPLPTPAHQRSKWAAGSGAFHK
eukprot:jgi/Tetstr1/439724/TSEL_028143.t1